MIILLSRDAPCRGRGRRRRRQAPAPRGPSGASCSAPGEEFTQQVGEFRARELHASTQGAGRRMLQRSRCEKETQALVRSCRSNT
eukprot:1184563-Prorocentrum_minimum.AAC.1